MNIFRLDIRHKPAIKQPLISQVRWVELEVAPKGQKIMGLSWFTMVYHMTSFQDASQVHNIQPWFQQLWQTSFQNGPRTRPQAHWTLMSNSYRYNSKPCLKTAFRCYRHGTFINSTSLLELYQSISTIKPLEVMNDQLGLFTATAWPEN